MGRFSISFSSLLVFAFLFIFIVDILFVSTVLAEECNEASSVNSGQIVSNISSLCCSKATARSRKKCIGNNVKKVKGISSLISRELFKDAKVGAKKLRESGCNLAKTKGLGCKADVSATFQEILDNASNSTCALEFPDEREKALKKSRRAWTKARKLMNSSFSQAVKSEVGNLLDSDLCGDGVGNEPAAEEKATGGKVTAQCGKVVDPRDGFKIGNVYKMSDHGGKPVFITHNGNRSGQAITNNGDVIESLNYTGLANADNKGLRHHYRMTKSCRSLPENFLLRIGRTCYEINDRCGRID